MDNIHTFTAQSDIEEQAADWLVRLDSEQPPSQSELAALKQWMNRSPAHKEQLRRLTQYWQRANVLTELSFPLPGTQRPKSVIGRFTESLITNLNQSWQGIAAISSVLVISLSILIFNPSNNGVSGNGVYETRIGEQNTITLSDGSVIQLNTHSKLQVNYIDHQRNVVLISGEAHFEVAKDSSRPFAVKAGEGMVRAVGTAFSVRLNQQAVKVIVNEGKVALASNLTLQPNPDTNTNTTMQIAQQQVDRGYLVQGQSVEFEPQADTDIASKIQQLKDREIEQQLSWRKGLLLFTGQSLREVVAEVNRYTTVTIEIVDNDVANISIGGQFRVGETEAMLKVLETSFNIDVRRKGKNTIQLALK